MLDFFSPGRVVVSCIISALCISGGRPLISVAVTITTLVTGQALLCAQCTSTELVTCGPAPPPASPCPAPSHTHCLTLKEYTPSLTDDADTVNIEQGDKGPGSLLFLARTCVEQRMEVRGWDIFFRSLGVLQDACTMGIRDGRAVEVCRLGH